MFTSSGPTAIVGRGEMVRMELISPSPTFTFHIKFMEAFVDLEKEKEPITVLIQ